MATRRKRKPASESGEGLQKMREKLQKELSDLTAKRDGSQMSSSERDKWEKDYRETTQKLDAISRRINSEYITT